MPDQSRRNPQVHQAVLDATWELLVTGGWSAVSVDAIAAKAGVGKRTIYRWWPGKNAVALEAFLARARSTPPPGSPASLAETLRAHARHFVDLYVGTRLGALLCELLGAAQSDPDLAASLREHWFLPRREPLRALITAGDPDLVLDLVFAPLHYRLLTGHAEVDHAFADKVVTAALLAHPAG
ncbi:TetR/AcrR family transcriptional regulator [Kutzneria sp. 744]|uniref:TetR/AcrR family transcriptional regulator n=1 Tax=Kutzneria sp. (strain 744) TaxID=345341 RepID=UPI0003EEABD3|nr:TetR/AcrR family transcriptional regulator [Kutzneria sp. 744]EWM10290.1 transcriptional regulator, TetR family [Kutzneria sp. 744]